MNHKEIEGQISQIWEKLNNPEWGVWRRIINSEQASERLAKLEAENADLRKRVQRLEKELPALLEDRLVELINRSLGDK